MDESLEATRRADHLHAIIEDAQCSTFDVINSRMVMWRYASLWNMYEHVHSLWNMYEHVRTRA